ncbi:reverse transcriptase domain-containing protein [Peribacillus simplex]|uniref:reverse transcriptase domain-containing protein n=1 Tax=Peribacillus simplex TaxID=1478 RepID=UPI0011DDCABD|nr:reverse transcriptase domain-containing protein [Peribacillus simplex]
MTGNEIEIETVLIRDISRLIEQNFFHNNDAYAKQQKDEEGNVFYKTIYNKIDTNIIKHMIENKKAIMSYQQKFDKLKWLCLDFDIRSKVLEENYDFFLDDFYRPMLISEVEKATKTLDSLNIKYTLEYSGNRGFHIWILLNKEINKQMGSAFVEGILRKIDFDYVSNEAGAITVDKYPKNNKPKSNKIGLGVKIPLSYHLKSKAYSYIVTDCKEAKKVIKLSEDFILKQKELIGKIELTSVEHLINVLDIESLERVEEYDRIVGTLKRTVELENVINMLSKCDVYKYIFTKEVSQLTELDRSVLTGTLIRLQTKENNTYGKDLLVQYFSSDTNVYNEDITNEKLSLMKNFFPPSLIYLQEKYKIECTYCNQNSINNVLELLEGIVIESSSDTNNLINWVIRAEKKYLTQNDEVPLNFIYDGLDDLHGDVLIKDIEKIKEGNYPNVSLYKFERIEEDKRRTMYSLSAKDRVLTTYIIYEINKVLYGEYASSSSYSYRLNYSYKQNDIFVNWNTLWLNYVKDIEDKILNDAYDDYYVLKLDIKSFYEEINQTFLREILYNKPTPLIELVLTNLNENDRKYYINMCEYLIDLSEQISHNGVPQGPAFARYLAEIYLSSLDQLIINHINDGFEHYFRYVDDMVLVLETKEKAEKLFNLIKNHLGKYDLMLNDKIMSGKVSELKYKIINQDLEKYFIDGIDEKTAPKLVVDKALGMLNRMFRNPTDNINIKQLPFYLTHLVDEHYIKSQLDELIIEITNNNIGRGSLFKHFYKNIVFKYIGNIDLDFYKQIKGLSRANFINELTRHLEKISEKKIVEIISFYLNEDLVDYEKNELFRLILKFGYEVSIKLKTEDIEIFIVLLRYTKQIKWNTGLLHQILKHLQSLENKSKVIEVMDKILTNSVHINENNKLVETIYITISEHENKIFSQEAKQNIFNLIAYISLYIDEVKLEDIWSKFHCNYNGIEIDVNSRDWYKYEKIINKHQILDSSVILILTRVFKQEGIVQRLGNNELEEEFSLYLFLYLFDNKEFEARDVMKQKVKQITKHKNIKFLEWCLNENTRYFPDEKAAIKNIHLNNRIVMMKDNYLLTRGKPEIFIDHTEDLMQVEEWYDDNEYTFVEIEIIDRLMNLEEKISNMQIFEALDFLMNIETASHFNSKYVNVFERGAFRETNNNLFLTFSRFDSHLVLDGEKIIINNNKVKFYEELINTFLKTNIKLRKYPLNYSINNKNFIKEFIPDVLQNPENRIEYMKILNNNIKKYIYSDGENIYTVELAKIMSIKEYINIETKRKQDGITKRIQFNRFSNNIKILNFYNSLYDNNFEQHLLYSSIKIDESSLETAITGIASAIKTNMEFDQVDFIPEFLLRELAKIKKMSNDEPSRFEFVQVERSIIDASKVKISGIDYNIENIDIYDFGSTEPEKELTSKELYRLIDISYIFFNGDLLVVLPNAISKIFEIINNKKGSFDKINLPKEVTITNDENYKDALEVIKLQSNISEDEAQRRIHSYLMNVDSKYYPAVLKVLSSYRCFNEEEMGYFVKLIIDKIDKSDENDCFLPLKNKNDDNGLHQILYVKNKDIFERSTKYENRLSNDFIQLSKENNFNELIIISDLGLSGTQFTNTLNNYTSNNNPKIKKDLHNIKNRKNFKGNLLKCKTITIINCIYTDIFKKRITEYFVNEFGYTGNLIFLGTEIIFKEHLFNEKITKKRDKEQFVEFVKKYYKDEEFEFQGKSYFEYLDNLEQEDTKNMLVARYKSMPKYHNVVFTKNTSLLKYRKE